MKSIYAIALLISPVLLFSQCSREETLAGTPIAIRKEINRFSKTCCSDGNVESYWFQNQTVYVFNPGSCGADQQSPILDGKGKTICALGGFTGNIQCNGVDFGKNALLLNQVWHK